MLPAPGAAFAGAARSRRAPVVAVLGAGAVAVGLAALPYKAFELDRFFVPKDVALQVVAAAALVAVGGARARTPGTPDAPGLDVRATPSTWPSPPSCSPRWRARPWRRAAGWPPTPSA
jgi:hypothetical protein